jgi:alanine racemase
MSSEILRSWAEVSLDALQHNARELRSLCPKGTAFMGVVKADAYGHGVEHVVPALAPLVDWFGVANLAEAREISAWVGQKPVMILGTALPSEWSGIREGRFVPVISSLEEARGFASSHEGASFGVHLAVDTGMGRIGVWETEALALAREIRALPGLELLGVGSHFPSADEDDAFTVAQTARFLALVGELRAEGLVQGPAHIANSAGLLSHPEAGVDLCRAGLALYGVSPVEGFRERLRPVLTWKTRVSLIREVGEGRGISYGRSFVAPRAMRVATLSVGYADGYQRHLSNRGAGVLIAGKRCPLLGRVTMDQILVDVSECPGAVPGDEAVLLGGQGGERISAERLAEWAGTIPWEIFTGIGRRVERLVAPDTSLL